MKQEKPKSKQKEKHFVYILECCDQSLYVGMTKDIERRLFQHNNLKSGARYTKTRRPVELKYFERHKTFKDAMLREIEIKRWKRERKLKLLQGFDARKKMG
ncbi:MAG: GIY-YIG nuclease family protein [Acidobacteriaceae bacterium]